MSKKSIARLVRDGVMENTEKRMSKDHCVKVMETKNEAQLAVARSNPFVLKAQAAEADYKAALAEAVTSIGYKLDDPLALCFKCGLVRFNPPLNGRGEAAPCPGCSNG